MIRNRSVQIDEVRRFAEAIGLERAAPARASIIFMFELYCRAIVPTVPGDPNKIAAEIRSLEGVASSVGTKRAAPFKHPPLKGFWKKHYLIGGINSIARNVELAFGRDRQQLRTIISRNHNPTTAHLSPQELSRNIANDVVGLYADRSRQQRLTGEWIIFGKHEGKNYYLCLAKHDETDDAIFERIERGCSAEFPFLFQHDRAP